MYKKPLVFILCAFVLGLILGARINLQLFWVFAPILGLSMVSFLITWFLPKDENFLTSILIFICLIGFGIFWIKFFKEYQPPGHLSNYSFLYSTEIEMQGVLVEQPQSKKDYLNCTCRLEKLRFFDVEEPVQGKVILNISEGLADFAYGDRIQFKSALRKPIDQRNPGGFDYAKFLASQDIYAICSIKDSSQFSILDHNQGTSFYSKIIFPLRKLILSQLDKLYMPQRANFLKGLLLGDKQEIPEDFLEALSKTGTSHILAVSGLHTGFILLITWIILRVLRFPRFWVTILTILGLVIFAIITNLKPPVVRSVIMAAIFLLGTLLQRRRNNYNTLSAAALVILLANPQELFAPGFQLSFGAVFSILYLYPKFVKFLKRSKIIRTVYQINSVKYIVDLLLLSLAVQIGTLPLTTYYFNLLPLLGLVANIIVVPLIGIILSLTLVSMLFAGFSFFLASLYSAVNEVLIDFIGKFLKIVAALPGSHIYVPRPQFLWILIFLSLILMLTQWQLQRMRNLGLISFLVVLNIMIWRPLFYPDPALKIIHFDVGQGDAALIQFENNQTILVDGGTCEFNYDYGERVILPYLRQNGIYRLDYVIATHPHNDHIGGLLSIFENMKIGQVIDNGDTTNSPIYKKYLRILDSLSISRRAIAHPETQNLAADCEIWYFYPQDSVLKKTAPQMSLNNNSIVFKLIFGQTGFLFTGDAEVEAEAFLLPFENLLQSDIIKIGHHGSVTSSSEKFLKLANPKSGVISVGEVNRFNHPSATTINRLHELEIAALCTDEQGAIVWESDGREVRRVFWK